MYPLFGFSLLYYTGAYAPDMPSAPPRRVCDALGRTPPVGLLALGLLVGAVVASFWQTGASPSSIAATSLRTRPGDLDPAAAHDASLAAWSATFGRRLWDGSGPGCDYSTPLARTSSHAPFSVNARVEFGAYLQALGATGPGLELGVQRGHFSRVVLAHWSNVSTYVLVDPWAHQSDYVDAANVDGRAQEQIMAEARANLEPWKDKLEWVRKYSNEAVANWEDCTFEFIYVDAQHDYEGALNDMIDYWPKLKPGGVMAGHDYLNAIIGGTIFGVRNAADRFATAVSRPLYSTDTEKDGHFPSFWLIK